MEEQSPLHPQSRVAQFVIGCCNRLVTLMIILLVIFAGLLFWFSSALLKHKKPTPWCYPDLTVAPDGSGNFTTISAAVDAAPENSAIRLCISIREGQYHENVFVAKAKMNLVFIEEGMGKTILISSRSLGGKVPAGVQLPTLWPDREHVVALESWADRSIFYRCHFTSHHATLYAHERRKFYCSCQIQGTRYFIFGDMGFFKDVESQPSNCKKQL